MNIKHLIKKEKDQEKFEEIVLINKEEKDSSDSFLEGELLKKYFNELDKSSKKYFKGSF